MPHSPRWRCTSTVVDALRAEDEATQAALLATRRTLATTAPHAPDLLATLDRAMLEASTVDGGLAALADRWSRDLDRLLSMTLAMMIP
jgi:hypothetical protein